MAATPPLHVCVAFMRLQKLHVVFIQSKKADIFESIEYVGF